MRFGVKFLFVSLVFAFLAGCGDDDSNNFIKGDGSTDIESSSSARLSSSSRKDVPPAVPCRTDSTDDCVYGTLVDERDGQVYKTLDIAGYTWMAENLNYAYLELFDDGDTGSVCFNHDPEYCEKYGRLYRWEAAMASCPSGWHVPDTLEWRDLVISAGTSRSVPKLRSSYDWAPDYHGTKNGTDDFGFTILPAGAYRDEYGGFENVNSCAYYWTSVRYLGNPFERDQVNNVVFDYRSDLIVGYGPRTINMHSVRCVKD